MKIGEGLVDWAAGVSRLYCESTVKLVAEEGRVKGTWRPISCASACHFRRSLFSSWLGRRGLDGARGSPLSRALSELLNGAASFPGTWSVSPDDGAPQNGRAAAVSICQAVVGFLKFQNLDPQEQGGVSRITAEAWV